MKKFPIDLSCLTEEEISQFQEDPYTLYNGDQNVAIYLRYSSTGQSDQSIEGQLRDCRTFCKANHYRIVAIYVDRATTARKDVEKRVHLMEMISDSAKQNWEYVIVWKLDRFARNRNDSAIMKMRLRKNGVKVLSATEHLTDSPESIILESVLEGMAEFFSAELSQKVTRGMRESALKCHSVGGHIPLGYKVENHKLVVDPDTAHIVQEAFSLYANGESVAGICRKFNSAGYKTAKNTEFNRSSFKAMFRNTRYIGTYTYKDIVIENGIPAIIDKELFETVQRRLSKTATAPARGKAKVDYLLSGKLFCGHCGASMNGESGAGRHGKVYHYYSCYTKKRKLGCDKRPLKKDYIEGIVARDALNLLTDQLIDEIADMAIRQSEQDLINDTHIPQLTAQLSEVEKSITNITAAIEKGIASETLMNRLVQLEHEKKTLNKEIKAEEKFVYRIDRDQIVFWLSQFKYGNIEDEDFRRRLIDLLVNSVTVWDEPDGYKITTAYNLTSCKTKTFRVEKNPAAEEATGFDFGESECAIGEFQAAALRRYCAIRRYDDVAGRTGGFPCLAVIAGFQHLVAVEPDVLHIAGDDALGQLRLYGTGITINICCAHIAGSRQCVQGINKAVIRRNDDLTHHSLYGELHFTDGKVRGGVLPNYPNPVAVTIGKYCIRGIGIAVGCFDLFKHSLPPVLSRFSVLYCNVLDPERLRIAIGEAEPHFIKVAHIQLSAQHLRGRIRTPCPFRPVYILP